MAVAEHMIGRDTGALSHARTTMSHRSPAKTRTSPPRGLTHSDIDTAAITPERKSVYHQRLFDLDWARSEAQDGGDLVRVERETEQLIQDFRQATPVTAGAAPTPSSGNPGSTAQSQRLTIHRDAERHQPLISNFRAATDEQMKVDLECAQQRGRIETLVQALGQLEFERNHRQDYVQRLEQQVDNLQNGLKHQVARTIDLRMEKRALERELERSRQLNSSLMSGRPVQRMSTGLLQVGAGFNVDSTQSEVDRASDSTRHRLGAVGGGTVSEWPDFEMAWLA